MPFGGFGLGFWVGCWLRYAGDAVLFAFGFGVVGVGLLFQVFGVVVVLDLPQGFWVVNLVRLLLVLF